MQVGPEAASPDDEKLYINFNFEFVDDTYSEWKSRDGIDNVLSQGKFGQICIFFL